MDERHLHLAEARRAARRDLLGAPAGARDDRRCAGLRGVGSHRARRVGEGADEPCAVSCCALPLSRNCSSSAAPVKAGSVPLTFGPCGCGSAVQRVQRPPWVRARTCACAWPRAQRRPTRSKRAGASKTGVTRHAVEAGTWGRGSSNSAGPWLEACAVEGSRSAPSATTPSPRTWRRVTSISESNTAWPRSERVGPMNAILRAPKRAVLFRWGGKMGMSLDMLPRRCAASSFCRCSCSPPAAVTARPIPAGRGWSRRRRSSRTSRATWRRARRSRRS